MKYRIRRAVAGDTKTINQLNKKYFHESGRDWSDLISGKSSEMYVIETSRGIIGFTGVMIHRWNNTARVIDVFVLPAHRRQGFGSALIKYLLRRVRQHSVRAIIAEAPSQNTVLRLYLKNGFRICGYNDRYYSNHGKEMAIFLSYDIR